MFLSFSGLSCLHSLCVSVGSDFFNAGFLWLFGLFDNFMLGTSCFPCDLFGLSRNAATTEA